jgi:hypothetical protein
MTQKAHNLKLVRSDLPLVGNEHLPEGSSMSVTITVTDEENADGNWLGEFLFLQDQYAE